MRTVVRLCIFAAVALFATNLLYGQESQDANRKISGGGITVPGWQGKVDPEAEKAGQTVNDAKLSLEGNVLHVTTGPAITYWNPKNAAKGDYTVSATFTAYSWEVDHSSSDADQRIGAKRRWRDDCGGSDRNGQEGTIRSAAEAGVSRVETVTVVRRMSRDRGAGKGAAFEPLSSAHP